MSGTILIVDDSRMERVVLNGYLKAEYDVLEAVSGEDAIELLRAKFKAVSAILLDVMMPGMDGFETLKVIKSNPVWLGIPVIIATGLDDEESREKAIACGADNFITKPYNRAVLLHILRSAVKLREMAAIASTLRRDSLTGLLNRESFFAEAERMIHRHDEGYFMLSCLDVENFKIINDQYGTDSGDEALLHIAKCLGDFATDNNGLACRYMADKFALLFPAQLKDTPQIDQCVEKMTHPACVNRVLRIRIGRYLVNDRSLPVSAMYDRAGMAEGLLKGRFDAYRAQYAESMRDALLREQQIVNDMVPALRNGEFEPWLQPQYNHATGALIGSEALVRWRKDGRIVPPNSFIPVFERNGFIYEVDQSIWRQVCALLRRWLDEGRNPPPVSVNISRYDLYQQDFLGVICALVEEYNLPADLLRLEITESAFSESTKAIVGVVKALIQRGFTVEIDDFGSGYSSLNTLKDVPASILKLDMRFFEETENSQRGGNIVESVVRMAKWLGMAIIAEGVEDKAQADYLKSIGCYYIQGYFYSRPVPVEDFEKLLNKTETERKLSRLVTLETLDNNEFWNPKSMETLIFNSYVGGASIFEYCCGKSELLRVNEQYVREMGGLLPEGAQLRESSLVRFLDREGKDKLISAIEEAIRQKKQASREVRLVDGTHAEYVRMTLRLIASTTERYLFYAVIVNITEQREAQRRQAESARQLEAIMGNVNGSVSAFQMDEDGNTSLLFGNDKYYGIFGYTKEQAEALRLDVMSCIIPDDFELVVAKLNQLKRDGKPISIDYRARKQDGSLVYIRSSSSRMSMEGYGDDVIVSVETDITEKLTLEDQLRAVIENINGGVSATYLRDDTPRYVIVNDKYYDILGYTREQFEAEVTSVFDLVHPDDRARVEALFREAGERRQPYTMEYRIVRRNGAVRHILCNTNVIRLFGVDEPVQLSVSNDVTVLREAQQKERDLSLQMRTIMSSIHGGITATVYHGGNHVEMVFANDGFYELYGYTREQLETELPNMLDLILPEDRAGTMRTVERIVRERGGATYEYRCRKRDGSIMWTQVTNAVISMSGVGDTVLLAIVTDITELRKAQQKEAETSDKLNAVLSHAGNGITAIALYDGKPEFLFSNDRYYEIVGYTREEYDEATRADLFAPVHPDDREALRAKVTSCNRAKGRDSAEYRVIRMDGGTTWVRSVLTITELAGVDAPVQIAVFADITMEREAESQLRFLNDSAHDILAQPDTEKAISGTLEKLMRYFGAERSYVIELDEENKVSNNTYEICATGVTSELQRLQNVPFALSEDWFAALRRNEFIIIENVAELSDCKAEQRQLLLSQNIRSLVISPLWRDGVLVGFVGLDNPAAALDQVDQLRALGDYIAILLTRRDLRRKIEHDKSVIQTLVDDTPGGFCRMEIAPGKPPTLQSLNEGFCRMLGMTEREARAAYGDNVLQCLAAQDVASASEDSASALAGAGQFSTRCRLRRKDGRLLWVMVFGRFVKDENGKLFLNAYFTDISEKKTAEQQQIELLDNLPSGAALYEYNGETVRAIHINNRYWELVGRKRLSVEQISVFGVFHPEDKESVITELRAAIRQNRDAVIDARIICGDGTYRPFRVTTNNVREDNGKYLLYATFVPISNEVMSIQEMLPIALSTMMSASEDLSYVKDREQRYLCCSDSVAAMLGLESARDIIGKTDRELFDGPFADAFIARGNEVLASGKALTGIVERVPVAGGEPRLISTSVYPIRDADGNAIGLYGSCRDITAQKEQESQLELVTGTIPGGVASYSIADGCLRLMYFTDGYCRAFGYTRDEYAAMVEEDPLAVVLAEDRPKVDELVRKLLGANAENVDGSATFRCRAKDGRTVWISMKAVVSMVGERSSVLNAIQLDVTDQIEAENLRADLLDNLPIGAALYEFDGRTLTAIHINKRYAQMVNRMVDITLEGFVPVDFIHPDDRRMVLDEVQDAIANRRNGVCEARLLFGENEYRTFRMEAQITPKGDGKHLLYVAYSRVSEQELTVRNLLPHLFSTIMESSTDLAFAKDTNFRYICCSRTFAQLLGLASEKDVVGKTDYELFPREIADMFRRDDSALFATRKPLIDIQEAIPSPDGTPHYTRVSKHLIRSAAGDIIGVYCIGRDVTEVREAYAQLKLLTDSIPGGMATFTGRLGDVRLAYFNNGLCDMSGYTRADHEAPGFDPMKLVFREDWEPLRKKIDALMRDEAPLECVFRIRTKGGGYKWVNSRAVVADHLPDGLVVNALFTDITEQQEEREKLRISEELNRLALEQSGNVITRFDVEARTLTLPDTLNPIFVLPHVLRNMPEEQIALGRVSPDTADRYRELFEGIARGEAAGTATYQQNSSKGWRWMESRYTTVFSDAGKPVSAVITFSDVTEKLEKEIVYNKWHNSLADRPGDSYTLFRCNLSKGTSYESWEGSLLRVDFDAAKQTFDERTGEYVEQRVYAEDRERYRAFLYSDTMLAEYYRGHRTDSLEYREIDAAGAVRWLRLTVELVEYPTSKDVEAYLMYENIDEEKRAELATIERAETDPLTGVLNRATFAAKVNRAITVARPEAVHAMLMLDVDGFKRVNDVFGHGAGDQVLMDVADALTKVSRKGDLVGRLGGDEFLVFLPDIPSEMVAAKKARQICELTRRNISADVLISASVGVAVCPRDGGSFEALYKVADETLYRIKGAGKNGYAFSRDQTSRADGADAQNAAEKPKSRMRRMLIVDDNRLDQQILYGMFNKDYIIEAAMDGEAALAKFRHFGSALSVVLLDLAMPVMDGYEVLRAMQQSAGCIPIIVVSADERRDTALRVIRAGASDLVTKPIDPELLRIRVESAVSKSENERLRAQNSFLSMQSGERDSYRAALEYCGILVATLDWASDAFAYSPAFSRRLAGKYDTRSLWDILLCDMVADSRTAQTLQRLAHEVAENGERHDGGMTARLKTASGQRRIYDIRVFKEADHYGIARKLIFTLRETDG